MSSSPTMQLDPPRQDLRPWFQTLNELDGPIDWQALFGNGNPVELDIGCGRGLFLYNESLAHPGRNYLGIEIDYKEGRRTATRLKKRQATNAIVFGGDARQALTKLIPPHSVAVAHVYFPDPWWKKKHRKRRLFTDEFVDQIVGVLVPRGELSFATDVADYFEIVQSLMENDPRFESLPLPPEQPPAHDMDYLTSYERKARKKGEPIGRGRWRLLT